MPKRARTPATAEASAGCGSMPHGTRRRRAGSKPLRAQSSRVACDGHITRVASRRASSMARRKKLTPRRVNCSGLRRNARSWTVTTSGADGGGTAMPVAWITSTGPVARSTAGRRNQCHDS